MNSPELPWFSQMMFNVKEQFTDLIGYKKLYINAKEYI